MNSDGGESVTGRQIPDLGNQIKMTARPFVGNLD
jgi:hypothetical protein